MVVLGLVLLVGAGVFAASVITSNSGAVGGDLWGLHISNVSMAGAFLAGVAAGAVALLGLVMMIAGSRRSQRLRRERRELTRENARLAHSVESADTRADSTARPARPVKPGVPANQDGMPVNRDGVPMDDRADRTDRTDRTDRMGDREPGYQSPPPPQYDRSAIESERGRAPDADYGAHSAGQPVPGEAPRRR